MKCPSPPPPRPKPLPRPSHRTLSYRRQLARPRAPPQQAPPAPPPSARSTLCSWLVPQPAQDNPRLKGFSTRLPAEHTNPRLASCTRAQPSHRAHSRARAGPDGVPADDLRRSPIAMKLDGDPSACNAGLHRRCRRVNDWHRVAYGDFRRPGQKTRGIDQLAGDRGHSHSGAIKLLGRRSQGRRSPRTCPGSRSL